MSKPSPMSAPVTIVFLATSAAAVLTILVRGHGIGCVIDHTENVPHPIQYGSILSEKYALTTQYPMVFHPRSHLCFLPHNQLAAFEDRSGLFLDRCKNIKDIIIESVDSPVALLELAGLNFKWDLGPLQVLWEREYLPNETFRFVLYTGIYGTKAETYDYDRQAATPIRSVLDRHDELVVWADELKFNWTALYEGETFVNFAFERSISACSDLSGLPVMVDLQIVGMVSHFGNDSTCRRVETCFYSCEEVKDFEVINLLDPQAQDALKLVVQTFESEIRFDFEDDD